MSDSETLDKVEQQLQSCLTHFYDYAFLYQHPLLAHLFPDVNEALRVQHFRDHVAKAIERLQPDASASGQEKASRAYNVLTLRYIHQYEIEDILKRLTLSRRQYFREHAKAVEILISLLLNGDAVTPTSADRDIMGEISIESEIASLNQAEDQIQVDLDTLLEGVIDASKNLATQREVQLIYSVGGAPIYVKVDRVLLRQITLSLCSSLMVNLASGSELHCDYTTSEDWIIIRWRIQSLNPVDQTLLLDGQRNESLQKMLATIGGELRWESSDQAYEIWLPHRQYTILIVDDNPDVVALFRRYLANQPFEIIAARDGEQAFDIAQKQKPHIIILDIMLPHQDGLEILQKFKTSPQTQHIPVVVCSILDAADLVMSLDAAAFIHKPPGQQEFVSLLARWFK